MLSALQHSSTSAAPVCQARTKNVQHLAPASRFNPACSPCGCSQPQLLQHSSSIASSSSSSSARLVSRSSARLIVRAAGDSSDSWTWNSPDWRALQRKGRAAGESFFPYCLPMHPVSLHSSPVGPCICAIQTILHFPAAREVDSELDSQLGT